jgi:hypothetical protein
MIENMCDKILEKQLYNLIKFKQLYTIISAQRHWRQAQQMVRQAPPSLGENQTLILLFPFVVDI